MIDESTAAVARCVEERDEARASVFRANVRDEARYCFDPERTFVGGPVRGRAAGFSFERWRQIFNDLDCACAIRPEDIEDAIDAADQRNQ